MKYILIIALVAGLGLWTGAQAATYAAKFPRATLIGVVERDGSQLPVFKHVDGATTCYIFGASIDCVK